LCTQELLRSLSEPQNAVLKQFQALWAMQGVTLRISDEAQCAIAREAHSRGTGARSLRSLLEELLLNAQFEAAEHPGCSIVLEGPGASAAFDLV
jgi:ATP-dependent Clp protease ATP-binding subunit ClpX